MIIFHLHLKVCGTCHSRDFLAHRLVEAEALRHLHMGLAVLSEGTDPDPVDMPPSQEAIKAEDEDRSGWARRRGRAGVR